MGEESASKAQARRIELDDVPRMSSFWLDIMGRRR